MAHSLAQQPNPSLPFPSAGVRPNPLGFSFGGSSFGSPHASPQPPTTPSSSTAFPFPKPVQPSPAGFGFGSGSGSGASPAFKQGVASSSARPNVPTSPPAKKKRSRQSSLSSASSSPAQTWATLPSVKALGKSPDLSGASAIDEHGERRRVMKRNMKRVRQDGGLGEASGSEDVDLGVLLATLPPTAHLPILLHLIRQNPALESTVLSQIPQPDLSECLAALDRAMSKCRKALGVAVKVELDSQRRWARASPEVEELVRIASTYISFFSTSAGKSPTDPHITHQLLHAITVDTTFLLGYVPPNTSTELSPIKQLLDLAKTLLDKWATWITDLSRDINQDGNMYPHSLVSQWADGLDSVALVKQPSQQSSATWSVFAQPQPQAQAQQQDNHLVSSFRQALSPLRERFNAELGWVIGRPMMGYH